MFNFVTNEVTGNKEASFSGKLVSVGETVLESKNENKTPYRVGTIEFEDAQGNTKQRSCMIWESNYKYGMQVGNSYLCKAVIVNGDEGPGVLLYASHLTQASRASLEDFGVEATQAQPEFTGA